MTDRSIASVVLGLGLLATAGSAQTISFVDSWGRESTSFVAGHTVKVRVRSEQHNVFFERDSVFLQVSSLAGGDSEQRNLLETGTDTGTFEWLLPTTRSLSPSGDGQLRVTVADTVTAVLLYDPATPSAQAQTTGNLVVWLDENGHPADTFIMRSRPRIRLIAPAAAPGPVSVQITAAGSGDMETVLLSAAGADTYEGEVEADSESWPWGGPTPEDGIFHELWPDTVTVSYTGSDGTSSDSAGFAYGRAEFLDAFGEVTSTYALGFEATVRMQCPICNHTPTSVEPESIVLANQAGDDIEYLSLSETGPDTGVYTGSTPLRSIPVQSYDDILSTQPGEWIQADWEGGLMHATADVVDRILEFLDPQGEPTGELLEGGAATVRMLDMSANVDPCSAESASVEIRALNTGDLETLVLTETGPDTGVFEGSIDLEPESGSHGDGMLQTANSGSPDYLPEEITALSGSAEATVKVLRARIEFIDAAGNPTSSYAAGETIRLRITNQATAGSSAHVQLLVLPALVAAGDVETVLVVQTAPGSIVLEGSIPVTLEESAEFDGELGIDGDEWVEVSYWMEYVSPRPLKARASIGSAPNRAPEPFPDYEITSEDQPVTISVLANDTDPDEDALTVAAVTQPAEGTVSIDPGSLTVTFTPAPNAYDSVVFYVTVSDPEGLEATSEVWVDVSPVNDAPVAVDDEASTPEETTVEIEILANDSDVDSEFFYPNLDVEPAHGTVEIGPSGAFYTPEPGFSGVDTFSYILEDTEGGADSATVTVTVTPVAPPRVTDNLQVLYELEEGSGITVADTSGVGTPLNLTIGNVSAVTWLPGGLSIDSPTLIQSATAATKVISAVKSTHSITLEAWVEPANTTQLGPAPVVTVSQTSTIRNFTLGQNGNRWEARVRTSNTNPNGYGHNTPVGSATPDLTHIVYTRDASTTVKLYINGTQVLSGYVTGTFATWPATQKLGLAAELNGSNPWLGKLYLVAVYNRALSAAEVQQNWEAGE